MVRESFLPPDRDVTSVLASLSHALDLTEGHPQGHAERSCAIALLIADLVGLPASSRAELVYAMLVKDAGCSSNAARVYQMFGGSEQAVKRAAWLRNWRQKSEQIRYALQWTERGGSLVAKFRRLASLAVMGPHGGRELFQIRCARGAEIARKVGLGEGVAQAIYDMDEHWDGGGHPRGLRGEEIPLVARFIGLAQIMEVYWSEGGPSAAVAVARERSGTWFDPRLAEAAEALDANGPFWEALSEPGLGAKLALEVPQGWALPLTPGSLDEIAEAFALIIDGKSPFTYDHSRQVARYGVLIGERMGLDPEALIRLRRAALVHDLGKLTVPNSILDKASPLVAEEWAIVQRHPAYTYSILQGVPALSGIALDAASHHERIDGLGYHQGLNGDAMSLTARIIAVSDIMDALAADRPYRSALPPDRVLDLLREGAGRHLCADCVEACSTDLIEQRGAHEAAPAHQLAGTPVPVPSVPR